MAKDYYEILGVKKTDSAETIKKAYRDAVKRLHPDVSPGRFDKKRFCEIQEAYETLGDKEKRKAYDLKRRRVNRRPAGNRVFRQTTPLDDLLAWMDALDPFSQGRAAGTREAEHRVGIILTAEEAYRGGEMALEVPIDGPCSFCGGRGAVGPFPCPACGGTGRVVDTLPVSITIPPRVEDGTIMRMPFTGRDGRRHTLVVFIEIDYLA